jgi:hypothetical protein
MELTDLLICLTVIVAVVYLMNKIIMLADARARIELSKRLAKSKERINAQQRGQEPESTGPEVGEWVPQLLSSFGLDPEVIFEEEMPDDLKRFLPLVKSFISSSGGISGLISKFAGAKPEDISPPKFGI